MQTKTFNQYDITHKNGSVEQVCAENLITALEHMEVDESFSPVIQTFMSKEAIRTLIDDLPAEVIFTATVNDPESGCVATPSTGKVHIGDYVSLQAVASRGYTFVDWKLNGKTISINPSLQFTFTEAELDGATSAVFTANFALTPVNWATQVAPDSGTGEGLVAFPSSGTTQVGATAEMIAVETEGYTFSHWECNGESVGTNKILSITMTSLAENESERIYKAVFNAD